MTDSYVNLLGETPNYRTMPVQKPGRSKQDYGTPRELIQAVELRFGQLDWDLAASKENAKAPYFLTEKSNYLTHPFRTWIEDGTLCWCNPPFANIGVWAEKWASDATAGARIIALVPASIGAEWFAEHVFDHATIIGLRPRITFEGCKDPYPKDCMLLCYGMEVPGGYFQTWRWK